MRIYHVVEENLDVFRDFFLERLLPVQQRYGARLVGRWVTEQRDRVVAIWEYDSLETYQEISEAIRSDPDSLVTREDLLSKLPPLYQEREDVLMSSTVPIELTLLTTST